jgi:hypothetical protein
MDPLSTCSARRCTLTAMFAALLAAFALQPVAATDTVEMDGRCEYPESVRQYRHETTLAICSRLTISREGGDTAFTFGPRSLGPTMKFTGRMSGNRMEVLQLALRNGDTTPAEGTCEIFYTNGEVSVVSCLAKAGTGSYAANFVKSRL